MLTATPPLTPPPPAEGTTAPTVAVAARGTVEMGTGTGPTEAGASLRPSRDILTKGTPPAPALAPLADMAGVVAVALADAVPISTATGAAVRTRGAQSTLPLAVTPTFVTFSVVVVVAVAVVAVVEEGSGGFAGAAPVPTSGTAVYSGAVAGVATIPTPPLRAAAAAAAATAFSCAEVGGGEGGLVVTALTPAKLGGCAPGDVFPAVVVSTVELFATAGRAGDGVAVVPVLVLLLGHGAASVRGSTVVGAGCASCPTTGAGSVII